MDIDGEGRIYQNGTNYQYDYYLKDHLGSTRMVINDQNQITEAIAYQPYGTIVPMEDIATSPQTSTRQQFTGKEFDREGSGVGISGMELYYFGKRYYDPEVGIFISTDPQEQYWNLYSYCGGDPVNYIDPNGENAGIVGMIIGGLIGGYTMGAISSGDPNPLNWRGSDWLGFAGGAMIGGAFGYAIGSTISQVSASNAALVPSGGSGITAKGFFEKAKILMDIAKLAGDGYKFVKDNLVSTGLKQPDGKQLYNSQLQWQINNGSKIEIDVSSKRKYLNETKKVAGGNYIEGSVVYTGKKFTAPSIRGINGQQLTYSSAEVLMHELLVHGIPEMQGNIITNSLTPENIVRRHLNLIERAPDATHIK